jgi:hypothetical protein
MREPSLAPTLQTHRELAIQVLQSPTNQESTEAEIRPRLKTLKAAHLDASIQAALHIIDLLAHDFVATRGWAADIKIAPDDLEAGLPHQEI